MSKKTFPIELNKAKCICCCKDFDDSILLGTRAVVEDGIRHKQIKDYASSPTSFGICDECKEIMKTAYIIIGIDPEKSEMNSNGNLNGLEGMYRSGQFVAFKKHALANIFPEEDNPHRKYIEENGFGFMEEKAVEQIFDLPSKKPEL